MDRAIFIFYTTMTLALSTQQTLVPAGCFGGELFVDEGVSRDTHQLNDFLVLADREGNRHVIHTRDELRPFIRIQSAECALAYVRLFTTPATFGLDEKVQWLEIIGYSASKQNYPLPEWMLGRGGRGTIPKVDGIVPDDMAAAAGATAEVRQTKNGFVISRLVGVFPPGAFQCKGLRRIKEFVSLDGKYRVISNEQVFNAPLQRRVRIATLP